ncbi:DNA repair and recombination protein [Wickerhamomyces ciferrii]|uniref:DNA repair and recombination protein n=1 Tax=Wickerhamomyces ciferrii (strain ATCC 14091 / BCRC 22168 / CBS 111 / JCM 3599 / NBRC 0793 / NRRL Y-1031 F-60-10) TaxID=1206466 RepID=K0KZ61_WICCF|nr:DNA repair and recombination protein [Wickerhamomyces ciferrii]CCH46403.1 DNA repair and recombination protein [Wickerhamomyces ciferrii]
MLGSRSQPGKKLSKKENPFGKPSKGQQPSVSMFFMKKSNSTLGTEKEPLGKTSPSLLNRSESTPPAFFKSKSSLSQMSSGSFDQDIDDGDLKPKSTAVNFKRSKPIGTLGPQPDNDDDDDDVVEIVDVKRTLPSYKPPQPKPKSNTTTSTTTTSSKLITPPTSTDGAKSTNATVSSNSRTSSRTPAKSAPKTSLSTSPGSSKSSQTTLNFGGKQLQPKRRMNPWDSAVIITKKMKNPRTAKEEALKQQKSSSNSYSYSNPKFSPSPEQQKVLDLVVDEKKSIFYTGSAGTGKSVLLKELVARLIRRYGPNAVAVTASTGLAAVNIGGVTINKFSGMGIGAGDQRTVAARVSKNSQSVERWKRTKVLIIDEISMIDGSFLDKLEYTARYVTKKPQPFGGIQVVLTGDFFQLPPVPDRNGPPPRFCFQAECWSKCINQTILLVQVFRQKENEFVELLNCLRLGEVSDKMSTLFKSLSREITYEDGIQPTELFCTRYEVDQANTKRLQKLPGKYQEFEAIDSGNEFQRKALDNLMAVKKLVLKEDAQVMMIKNKDDTLVNGSVGIVVTFFTAMLYGQFRSFYKDYELVDDSTMKQAKYISSCIAADTIPEDVLQFASRLPNRSQFMQLCTSAQTQSRAMLLPLVKFSTVNGSRLELVDREDFSLDNDGETGASRSQLPLLLSWALSIHKSQGQTLDRVKVDLTKVFEMGQVYVALSRAVSKDRLQLINFDKSKIRSSGIVKQFYEQLRSF